MSKTGRSNQQLMFVKVRGMLARPSTHWTLTLLWTALAAYLMFAPSGDGTSVTWVSRLFGGTEQTDAAGHVLLNAVLVALWLWTLRLYFAQGYAYAGALFIGLCWGLFAELSQRLIPTRGATFLDLWANLLGVMLGALGSWYLQRRRSALTSVQSNRG